MMFHLGPFGVKVFFVISGFLITNLLLNEERRHGSVSIKEFYIRRAFRIWPVAYAYLFVLAVLTGMHVISVAPHYFVYAGAFLTNQVQEGTGLQGIFGRWQLKNSFMLYGRSFFCSPRGADA